MKHFKSIIIRELPFITFMPSLLWLILFLCIPIAIIIGFSFMHNGETWTLTLANYQALLHLPYVRILGRSLFLAASTATICLFFAYPVAYFLAVYVQRYKNILLLLLTLPFWTNILVQVYAWYFLLEQRGIVNNVLLKIGLISEPLHIANSIPAILTVMVYCYMPFMIMPLYSTLEKLNTRLLEASLDLGASPWQTLLRVTVPLSLPGIKTGILLVFIPCFGEFAIPILMGGSKYMTVGALISHYFLVAHDNGLGAAFTCISSLVLLMVVIMLYTITTRPSNNIREKSE